MTRYADLRLDGKWNFTGKGFTLPCHIPNVYLGIESELRQKEKFASNEMAWLLGDDFDSDLSKAVEAFGMAQDEQGDWEYDATEGGDNLLTELEVDENGILSFGDEESIDKDSLVEHRDTTEDYLQELMFNDMQNAQDMY